MTPSSLFILFENQLFPLESLSPFKKLPFYLAEDFQFLSRHRFHQHKLIFTLASGRRYIQKLIKSGFTVHHFPLDEKDLSLSYEKKLERFLQTHPFQEIITFEIENEWLETRIQKFTKKHHLSWKIIQSPMFTVSRTEFKSYLSSVKKPFLKSFYEQQRKKQKILLDRSGKPEGGKWSFDSENRLRLPQKIKIPSFPFVSNFPKEVKEVKALITKYFSDHPGDPNNFWLPTSREEALDWLEQFVQFRLIHFGKYEDALSQKDPFLFHSLLSPFLNLGLLTPQEVIQRVLDEYQSHKKTIPLGSLEGFIRQVIGWREFIRGIYQNFHREEESKNFWNHRRKLNEVWYTARSGIPLLDHTLSKAIRYGYNHHIERLMVLSNFMLLCEVDPQEVYRWFMEMYIDSDDWVMAPNVFGMGQFSDGGIFATKPYICASHYLLKMSDSPKGEWCQTIDALYWDFIRKHQRYFQKNIRMKWMVKIYSKKTKSEIQKMIALAESFRERVTKKI